MDVATVEMAVTLSDSAGDHFMNFVTVFFCLHGGRAIHRIACSPSVRNRFVGNLHAILRSSWDRHLWSSRLHAATW